MYMFLEQGINKIKSRSQAGHRKTIMHEELSVFHRRCARETAFPSCFNVYPICYFKELIFLNTYVNKHIFQR